MTTYNLWRWWIIILCVSVLFNWMILWLILVEPLILSTWLLVKILWFVFWVLIEEWPEEAWNVFLSGINDNITFWLSKITCCSSFWVFCNSKSFLAHIRSITRSGFITDQWFFFFLIYLLKLIWIHWKTSSISLNSCVFNRAHSTDIIKFHHIMILRYTLSLILNLQLH